MSIALIPPGAKLGYFMFNTSDTSWYERGLDTYGDHYTVNSTPYTTQSTTRVNAFTIGIMTGKYDNMARVRVYAHVSGAVNGSQIWLNINGSDAVGPVTVTETISTLKIDYVFGVSPNTNYTIRIDIAAELSFSITYDKAIFIFGYSPQSTTLTPFFTVTFDFVNIDYYNLKVKGKFAYALGVRWFLKGNRKSTAPASFSSNLTNEVQGYYNPSAGDDGDNNAIITMRTGDFANSFTISGAIGAPGDIVIITGVYAQIVLRGNQEDFNSWSSNWPLVIKEDGIAYISFEYKTLDGSQGSMGVYKNTLESCHAVYEIIGASPWSTDFYLPSIQVVNMGGDFNAGIYGIEHTIYLDAGGDSDGRAFVVWVLVIVLEV
jgi:hypothetical protein